MLIIRTQEDFKAITNQHSNIGFVATMGTLHEGHFSLIRRSKKENELTVCSIFINPTQFNASLDLKNYPFNPEKDIKALEEVGCDIVFLPENKEEVYKNENPFSVQLGMIDQVMEGEFRPGHFEGVMRVVKLLLEIVQPTRAYFGLKDFQQYLVVRTMVEQLEMKIEIVGCETIRSSFGLALSSRNELLKGDYTRAIKIREALLYFQKNKNETPLKALIQKCKEIIRNVGELEYFEVYSEEPFNPLQNISTKEKVRVLVAATIDGVRLIDNCAM